MVGLLDPTNETEGESDVDILRGRLDTFKEGKLQDVSKKLRKTANLAAFCGICIYSNNSIRGKYTLYTL